MVRARRPLNRQSVPRIGGALRHDDLSPYYSTTPTCMAVQGLAVESANRSGLVFITSSYCRIGRKADTRTRRTVRVEEMLTLTTIAAVSFCLGFYFGRDVRAMSADLKEPLLVTPHFTLGGEGAVRVTLRNELAGVVLMTMKQSPIGAVTVAAEPITPTTCVRVGGGER